MKGCDKRDMMSFSCTSAAWCLPSPTSLRTTFIARMRPVSFLRTCMTFPNAPRPTTERISKSATVIVSLIFSNLIVIVSSPPAFSPVRVSSGRVSVTARPSGSDDTGTETIPRKSSFKKSFQSFTETTTSLHATVTSNMNCSSHRGDSVFFIFLVAHSCLPTDTIAKGSPIRHRCLQSRIRTVRRPKSRKLVAPCPRRAFDRFRFLDSFGGPESVKRRPSATPAVRSAPSSRMTGIAICIVDTGGSPMLASSLLICPWRRSESRISLRTLPWAFRGIVLYTLINFPNPSLIFFSFSNRARSSAALICRRSGDASLSLAHARGSTPSLSPGGAEGISSTSTGA
eukprot:Opistho-2@51345